MVLVKYIASRRNPALWETTMASMQRTVEAALEQGPKGSELDASRGLLSLDHGQFEESVIQILSAYSTCYDWKKDVSCPNGYGQTLAHLAVTLGYIRLLEQLISWEIDLSVRDTTGATALHFAYIYDHPECVSLLTRSGANQQIRGELGRKPAPLPSLPAPSGQSAGDDGSTSIQQEGVQSSTLQGQSETFPYTGIDITIPHPTANATDSSSNVRTTIQETEPIFFSHTSTHPSAIPEWLQSFNEWLPTRRQYMSSQGLGDPLACRPVWAGLFGQWFQNVLSDRGVDDLAVIPLFRNWNGVFDNWLHQLLKPDIQGFDAPHASPHPTLTNDSSVYSTPLLATPNTLYMVDLHSTPPGCKARKRIPNASSKLTVPEIQESCRRNGAEESAIARLAVVFPDVVKREHLKLAGQPGDQRRHQGYMEFAERCMVSLMGVKKTTRGTSLGQVQRYRCKLCGQTKRPRWKNSKDLLDHVWDTHCDPQGDSIAQERE